MGPVAKTKWNRNDQELPAHRVNQIVREGKHILEISKPRKSDAGIYTCEAANPEGEISAVLTIEEKENMQEVFDEFLNEVPEMIKDIQETSGAAGSGPVTFLLSSVLVVASTLRNMA